jgi:hypothetical protein
MANVIRVNINDIDDCINHLSELKAVPYTRNCLTAIKISPLTFYQGDYAQTTTALNDEFSQVSEQIDILLSNTIQMLNSASAYFVEADTLQGLK